MSNYSLRSKPDILRILSFTRVSIARSFSKPKNARMAIEMSSCSEIYEIFSLFGFWWRVVYIHFWQRYLCYLIYSVNSLRPGDAYMRHQNRSSLVQVMACRLFEPLSKPMLRYSQLGPTNVNEIRIKIQSLLAKRYLKMSFAKCLPFYISLNVLSVHSTIRQHCFMKWLNNEQPTNHYPESLMTQLIDGNIRHQTLIN